MVDEDHHDFRERGEARKETREGLKFMGEIFDSPPHSIDPDFEDPPYADELNDDDLPEEAHDDNEDETDLVTRRLNPRFRLPPDLVNDFAVAMGYSPLVRSDGEDGEESSAQNDEERDSDEDHGEEDNDEDNDEDDEEDNDVDDEEDNDESDGAAGTDEHEDSDDDNDDHGEQDDHDSQSERYRNDDNEDVDREDAEPFLLPQPVFQPRNGGNATGVSSERRHVSGAFHTPTSGGEGASRSVRSAR